MYSVLKNIISIFNTTDKTHTELIDDMIMRTAEKLDLL